MFFSYLFFFFSFFVGFFGLLSFGLFFSWTTEGTQELTREEREANAERVW
ncbi:MAG: hypothetical protein MRERV_41c009 [Mycoplasmataceae bacterium RV_VA103A]|nr:MAG: hypothetical protein MRERV_41c009 [Mycoplasmataceae bacterium RV_VA103A]